MAAAWKLYIACWFLGAAVQSVVFFSYNAVDYFNYFFPDDYKPEVYIGVTASVGSALGAVLTVCSPPKQRCLTVLMAALIVSGIILMVEVLITPLQEDTITNEARFGVLLGLVFLATVIQNVGGGALYYFVGKHIPQFGVLAAQSGGVCAFAATFVVRCISKGSFQHEKDVRRGFRLSGYMYVALVDLIILLATFLIAILKPIQSNWRREVNDGEIQSLLTSRVKQGISYSVIIRKNWCALATICLTLVICDAVFPGVTSQFHGNYNCSTTSLMMTSSPSTSDKTGWFVVILFGCFSVSDTIGKNIPILGIIYSKKTILVNLVVQLVIAVPALLVYFEPCVTQLQSDWVAYVTVGLLGLVTGYGICTAMVLLAPGECDKRHEEGIATSIGFMFLQVGILCGMGISLFLVEYLFKHMKYRMYI